MKNIQVKSSTILFFITMFLVVSILGCERRKISTASIDTKGFINFASNNGLTIFTNTENNTVAIPPKYIQHPMWSYHTFDCMFNCALIGVGGALAALVIEKEQDAKKIGWSVLSGAAFGALVGWRYSRREVQETHITLPYTVTIPQKEIFRVIPRYTLE